MTEPRQLSATESTAHAVSIGISKTLDAYNGFVRAIRALGEDILAEQPAAGWSVAGQADLVLLVQSNDKIRFTLQQLAFGQAHLDLEVGDDANLIRAVMRSTVTFLQKLRLEPTEQLQVAIERSIEVEVDAVNKQEAAPRLITHSGDQRGSLDPNLVTYSVDANATEILFNVVINADKSVYVGGIFTFDCGDLSVHDHGVKDFIPTRVSTSTKRGGVTRTIRTPLRPGYTEYKFFVKLCFTAKDIAIHLGQTSPFQTSSFLEKAAGATLSDRDDTDSYILARDELKSLRYTVSTPIIVERRRRKGGASPPERTGGATDSSSSKIP